MKPGVLTSVSGELLYLPAFGFFRCLRLLASLGSIPPPFLPALPSQWAQGEINGIVARGNFEIDMKWTNNTVDYATIKSVSGSECQIKLNDADNYKVIDENGNPIAFTVANGTIRFETTTGASYTVVKI